MVLNKFGHSNSGSGSSSSGFGKSLKRGPPGIGFTLTAEGDFDIRNKQLKHVADPQDTTDAINKKYFDDIIKANNKKFHDNIQLLAINVPNSIESKIAPLRQQIKDLNAEQTRIKTVDITPIEQSLTALIPTVQTLTSKHHTLETNLNKLETQITAVQQSLASLIPTVQTLSADHQKLTEDSIKYQSDQDILNSMQAEGNDDFHSKLEAIVENLPQSQKSAILSKWKTIEQRSSGRIP